MVKSLARALGWLLLIVLGFVFFDVIAYFSVPASYTAFAPSYRHPPPVLAASPPRPVPGRGYPRYYFQADREMGFDITPKAAAVTTVDGYTYDIFSNDLGCFDRNQLADFRRAPEYAYFAGDSFTWGYSRYDTKFATVWEQRTKTMAAKCGITHSGQRHQFAKFVQVTSKIGTLPKVVFVGFFPNDPANDLAYPHTTVIDGYQVDTVYFKNGELVRPDISELTHTVEAGIRQLAFDDQRLQSRLMRFLQVYSLSAHLIDTVIAQKGSRVLEPETPRPTSIYGASLYEAAPLDVVRHYLDDSRTLNNRLAVKAWGEDARSRGYRLVFVLIPPQNVIDDAKLFDSVKTWLRACQIEYVDLTSLFGQAGVKTEDVYWQLNGHLNERGNVLVGEELARKVR